MISYAPLWRTMKEKSATTYTLRNKGNGYNVNGSSIRRIKSGQSVSTNTLDAICRILDCRVEEIIEYIPDERE